MSLNASIFPIVTLVPSSYDDSFSGYLLCAAAFTPSEFCFSIIALYTYLLANNVVWEEKMSLYILKLYQFLIEIANTSLQLFQMLTSCDRKCKWEVWGVLVACLGSHKLFHAFLVMMAYTLKLNAKINCSSLKKKEFSGRGIERLSLPLSLPAPTCTWVVMHSPQQPPHMSVQVEIRSSQRGLGTVIVKPPGLIGPLFCFAFVAMEN